MTSLDPALFGDEPVLIKKSLPNVDVIVGKNRYENGLSITCDVYLLDDAFQHLQLARDLDIVIDVPHPRFSREGRAALRAADVVIPRNIAVVDPQAIRGRRVLAFAGLADNEQFFVTLRDAGAELAATRGFPDHHLYTPADVASLRMAAAAADAAMIVTTEKDAVKVPEPDIIAVPIEFVIPAEAARSNRSACGAMSRSKSRLLQRVEYSAYRSVAALVRRAGDESLARWGSRFGALSARLLRRRDRLAHAQPSRGLSRETRSRAAADPRRVLAPLRAGDAGLRQSAVDVARRDRPQLPVRQRRADPGSAGAAGTGSF